MTNKLDFNWFNLEYAKALSVTIDKDAGYSERRTRREYALVFNTPLHIVYTLDFTFVLQNLYEHSLQNKTKQQLAAIIAEFIPSLGQAIEQENQDFMKHLEASIIEKNKKKQEKANKTPKKQSEDKKEEAKAPEINMSFQDEDPDLL